MHARSEAAQNAHPQWRVCITRYCQGGAFDVRTTLVDLLVANLHHGVVGFMG